MMQISGIISAVIRAIGSPRLTALEQRVSALEASQLRYAGVYQDGELYHCCDMVTYSGSLWFCHTSTTSKPGTDDWQLVIKHHGRNRRDGKDLQNEHTENK